MRQKSTFVGLFFLLTGAVLGFVIHLAVASAFGVFRITDTEILGPNFRLSSLIGAVVGLGAAAVCFKLPRTNGLIGEVIEELNKVHWPSGDETRMNTGVVIITSVVAALILGFFDITFGQLSTMLAEAKIRF